MSFKAATAVCGALMCLQAAAQTTPLTQDEALKRALTDSPELIDALAELGEAAAQLEGADRLLQQNPALQLGAGPQIKDPDRSGDYGLQVMQTVELFGQRGARIDAATSSLQSAEARLLVAKSEIALRVRAAFARALAAKQEVAIADDSIALTTAALQAAEARLAAGAASQIEVNAARIERGRAANRRVASLSRLRSSLVDLALLVGIRADAGLEVDGVLREGAATFASVEELIAQALNERPEARAARADLEAARAAQRFADRSALPEVQVGAAYDDDEGIVKGMVGLNVPVFNQNQAERGAASARVRAAEQRVAAVDRRIRAEIAVALQRLEFAKQAAEALSTGALTASKENLSLVDEGYRAGKLDFLQLLIIRRDTLDARRDYVASLEELAVAEAQVLRSLGRIQ